MIPSIRREGVPVNCGASGRRTSTAALPITAALLASTPLIRHALRDFMCRSRDLTLVGTASTTGATITLCRKVGPDILIVDSATDPGGWLVKEILARGLASTVVLLVGQREQNSHFVSSMVAVGTHGIVAQNAELSKLAVALRSAHYLRSYIDPELTPLTGATLPPKLTAASLSPREHEILQLIASGSRNGEIADQLGLSIETVRSHVKSCLRKLNARDRVQAVHVAYTLGFLTPPISPSRRNNDQGTVTPTDVVLRRNTAR